MGSRVLPEDPAPDTGGAARGRRRQGLVLAGFVSCAAIALQYDRYRDETAAFSRFDLPAYDPYVYVAMAEQPAFFTVAPWGYRVLTPWIAHHVPARNVVWGFRYVTAGGLAAAGALLFLYLRRLGHGEGPALLAVAAFGFSAPVGEALRTVILADPLSVALEIAFLLAVESGAGVAVLALLAVLLSLGKEIWLLLLPLVYLAEREKGRVRALLAAVAVGLPCLVAGQGLRSYWAPHIQPPHAPIGLDLLRAGWSQLGAAWGHTWPALALQGLVPVALLGALRPAARPFLLRYGYLLVALVALALGAWIYVPAPTPVPFFGRNTLRLMIYALPLLLPLALHALDRVWPHVTARPPRARPRGLVTRAAAAAAIVCAAVPYVALDRYRRVALHAARDGPLALTVCRESLRAARRLEAGREVVWDLSDDGYDRAASNPRDMSRMRWYLREGWGPLPHYRPGSAAMEATEASFLLPTFTPADRRVLLSLEGAPGTRLRVDVNGTAAGEIQLGAGVGEHDFRLPAATLFRGDNRVTLTRSSPDGAALRLHRVVIRPGG